MSFAIARGQELREALDRPVAVPLPPAADIALLRGAVESWIAARRSHLDALLLLLREPDARPQADGWRTHVAAFRESLRRFAGVLGSSGGSSEWARTFVSMNTTADEKFATGLEKAIVAAEARDYMTTYLQTIRQQTRNLEIKWDNTLSRHQSYQKQQEAAVEEVHKIVADAISSARDLETKIVSGIGNTLQLIKDALQKLPEGGADAMQIPFNNELVAAGLAVERFRALLAGVDTQSTRFESYFREEIGSVLFLFKDSRKDTKEFIDKFGYKEVLEREDKARSALESFVSAAASSSGNKIDAEQFAEAAKTLVKGHVNNARNTWDDFVQKHGEKFFGPIAPNVSRALLDRDIFQKKYERLQALNLHELAQKWRNNVRAVWEVDLSGIPRKLADRYRRELTEKLRDLDEILKRPFLDRFRDAFRTSLDTAERMIRD